MRLRQLYRKQTITNHETQFLMDQILNDKINKSKRKKHYYNK